MELISWQLIRSMEVAIKKKCIEQLQGIMYFCDNVTDIYSWFQIRKILSFLFGTSCERGKPSNTSMSSTYYKVEK